MKVSVDRTRCVSYAICIGVAPDVFLLDDADRLELVTDVVTDENGPRLEEAVLACPAQALSLSEREPTLVR